MKTAEQIRAALQAEFPPEMVKTKPGGNGKDLSYVEGHAVLDRLDDACNTWSFHVTWRNEKMIRAWVYNKQAGQKELVDQQVLMVEGVLEIPELGSRVGIGVQELNPGAGADVMKGAWTDAIKVAASRFGVARHLYQDSGSDQGSYQGGQQGSYQGGNRQQGGGQRQYGGGQQAPRGNQGGAPQNGPTPPQWKLFNTLVDETGVNAEELAKAAAGYGTDRLNKKGISLAIDAMNKIKANHLQLINGALVAPDGGDGSGGSGGSRDVMADIANAPDADRLNQIAGWLQANNQMGPETEAALDKRADELGID